MSSQSDVLKSLLRSTALSALARVRDSALTANVKRVIADASFARTAVPDAALTAAVARVAQVAAATVRSGHGELRADVSFEDGAQLRMALRPDGLAFAPFGAKELAFAITPESAADHPRGRDVVAAIAAEIARNLWRPALLRAPRADATALVSSDQARLIVDLRSVPEVRWALHQRLPALLIEAIKARAIEVHEGRLLLLLSIEGAHR